MFYIDNGSSKPIFEQLKTQVIKYVEIGILKEDDKLPSVRILAMELGINPNTVMKAYKELEEMGYIYTLNKKGVFIKGVPQAEIYESMLAECREQILQWKKRKIITKEKLLAIIEEVYREEV
ncbi:MAG: GntR family transcriptional regulator [Erysipelotrichaceae bacterium]|nr:GntR family transcriptional regulator [Erysipelotrichaceae bacterium]MDY5252145.1 GntR family transcriptional regulator [Erysipelotrichaceae bacterium]